MNNLLDSHDYVAGALAAVSGDIEIKLVAENGRARWYRVCDPFSEECRVVVASYFAEDLSFEPCDPDDKADFTKAFIKTMSFGDPGADAQLWATALEDGWVDQDWIDLQILRPILERGAAELGTDFDFDVWAVEGVRGKKPKRGCRK